ncbi:hypothetical protein [Beggiatoa leptomitoformis]|uniref:Phage tail protein n=1 Tax=Beggiatoa leptomitoformis TaxID=288004 RepID=A0A2N9YH90_9GAMM|nr:hypothetical protein [Beggiatoa leptomitoformis]ALG67872.1 hypothetical protein AL038_09315 [Beggiatoa leptomitoformis]AUI69867.1 hypothetical protein BLE401_14985 [Beggiatoa leptomitoformis]
MAYEIKFTKRAVVEAALEATAGVNPNSGFTAILANVGAKVDKNSTPIDRNVLDREFGAFGSAITASMFKESIEVEMKALGREAGNILVPEWTVPLQACATVKNDAYVLALSGVTGTFEVGEEVSVTSTVVGVIIDIAGTTLYVRKVGLTTVTPSDVVDGESSSASGTVSTVTTGLLFEPTSDESLMKSMTARFNQDGILKISTYMRGTAVITGAAKALPKIAFDLTGIYNAPTDTAMPDVTTSGVKPIPFQNVTLTWGDLDVSKIMFSEFSLDLGNVVVESEDSKKANSIGGVFITDGLPKLKLIFSQSTLAEYNPFAEHETPVERDFAVTYGVTDKFIRVGARKVQITTIAEQEKNNINFYTLDCTCNKGGLTPKWYIAIY